MTASFKVVFAMATLAAALGCGRQEKEPPVGPSPAEVVKVASPAAGLERKAPRSALEAALPEAPRGIGTLTARAPGSDARSETALDLVSHTVDATLRDGAAITQVEEVFANRSGRTVEATYRFLLPERASIVRLALEVNGRMMEGEVLEKARARRIFKRIVDDSVAPRDPALLEWVSGSSFSMKIFPIKPGEERRVLLAYVEPMTAADGRYRYVYPLSAPAGAAPAGMFSVRARIESAQGAADVTTPLYPTRIELDGRGARVSFEATRFSPTADFVLEYGTRDRPAPLRARAETSVNGETYGVFLVRPETAAAGPRPSSRVAIVADTSYGVPADVRALSNAVVIELLAGLRGDDLFTLLACDSGCRAMPGGPLRPSAASLAEAARFLEDIPPGGASDVTGAFEAAFEAVRGAAFPVVVYVGDGVPTSGELTAGDVVKALEAVAPKNAVVHTVGAGANADDLLLDAVASRLGGSSHRLSIGESPVEAAAGVARRIGAQGLERVSFEWPEGISLAYPQRIGAIPPGSEIAVVARLDRPSVEGDVVLRGFLGGKPVERRFGISLAAAQPAEGGSIAKLWAKARIDDLTLEGGRDPEIVELSRRARVASRLTSWLVLESERMYERFGIQRTDGTAWRGPGEEPAFDGSDAKEDERNQPLGLDEATPIDDALDTPDDAAGRSRAPWGSGSASPMAAPKAEAVAPAPAKEKRAGREEIAKDTSLPGAPGSNGQGLGGGGASLATGYGGPGTAGPTYDVRITAVGPAPAGFDSRVEDAVLAVRSRPLERATHRRLVGLLARLGRVDEAMDAATTWVAADPMSAEALAAFADQLARKGDRLGALRAYASQAEVQPGSAQLHRRLALAMRGLGLYAAASGHLLAAASITGSSDDRYEALRCLAAAAQPALFRYETAQVLSEPGNARLSEDARELERGAASGVLPAWPDPPVSGELVVKAVARGDDLDMAVLDPAGHRVSGLWPRGATSRDVDRGDGKVLAIGSLVNGRYRISVSRNEATRQGPVSGSVTVRCHGTARTIPFTLVGADAIVAEVSYRKIMPISPRLAE
ncbi:MAG: VIT domain-containing protein [Deltaproteobacteria bacterium]|nr:VIT domain-containing protein [Deltaproteobacteria bacterium]